MQAAKTKKHFGEKTRISGQGQKEKEEILVWTSELLFHKTMASGSSRV